MAPTKRHSVHSAGRPDPARHVSAVDAFLVPFSLLWRGFAIFWTVGASLAGAPFPFALFGLPLVALGLYLVFGRFICEAKRKGQTVYALTEGRALVVVGSGSLSGAPLLRAAIEQRRSRDGRHLTVTFGRSARAWSAGPSYANTGLEFFDRGNGPLAFYDVSDVSGLATALRLVRRRSSARPFDACSCLAVPVRAHLPPAREPLTVPSRWVGHRVDERHLRAPDQYG